MDACIPCLLLSSESASPMRERIGNLVTAAAHCASTEGALLFLGEEGRLDRAMDNGVTAGGLGLPGDLLDQLMQLGVYIGREQGSKLSSDLRASAPELRFLASIAVEHRGERVGLLVVLDREQKSFSAAQEYLLRTLATEISDQLELEQLRRTHEEQRNMRQTADERLRLLESVVVNANDAVLITEAEPFDLPGPRILYANAAFTRTTGYTLEEILGKTPRILQGPETDKKPLERLKAALREWKAVEVELQNYRKDGSTFWVELSIVPVADETGWYTHWVSVQRDISERKQHEENALRVRLAEARSEALAKEVKERMRSEAELAHTAFHDHLTGLRNRAYFLDRLKSSIEQCRDQPEYRCAVIFIDLDDFKGINDRFGHSLGDLTLVEVAQRLLRCSRPQDTVARMGGDEFTILLDNVADVRDVAGIAERVLETLADPVQLAENAVTVRASIGLSLGSYSDPEQLLRAADVAMYRAKEEGGSRYAIFNEAMHASAMTALRTRVELREAFERNQFELYYQPLVNTGTSGICGVEALVRWCHPERGLVPPLEFIPIAEETGLIVQLGSWVLHEACRHLQTWKSRLRLSDDFRISVNVSTRQLNDPGFFDDLQSALAEGALTPRELQLEITESVFLENPERMGSLFQRIRALGVHIACDDFGTGYSSLSYLQLYPIDTIKIDQSFVRRLRGGQSDADIVRMIVSLAQALGMDVSAEGVEELWQRGLLEQYGCTVVQGYLYSPPLPLAQITHLLQVGLEAPAESVSGSKLPPSHQEPQKELLTA